MASESSPLSASAPRNGIQLAHPPAQSELHYRSEQHRNSLSALERPDSTGDVREAVDTEALLSGAQTANSPTMGDVDFLGMKKSARELKALKIHHKDLHTPPSATASIIGFYHKQNDLIDTLVEVDGLHRGEYTGDEVDEVEERRTKRAMHLSFASNIVLLLVRVGIAAISGSLSIIVTTLDAVLDVISGFIIWFTALSIRNVNKYKYPIGKTRMEPLGIIVFSCIMGSAGFYIVLEGCQQLVAGAKSHLPALWIIISGSLAVILMKAFMYWMCRDSSNPSVQAFALDHLNDVIVNSVGLVGALLGNRVAYWLDPTIAMVLSMWLIWAWGRQALENIMALIGMSASPEQLQKLTYLCCNHSSQITKIDTVRAYTFGHNWFVEVDVVLPEEMSLRTAHDIGESLQIKLERLPDVARAFVHLDYETSHRPEHKDV